tara:strand:- start:537 stop:1610 length:1074 start_codon:yes stop_codon:yes gene_type:complete
MFLILLICIFYNYKNKNNNTNVINNNIINALDYLKKNINQNSKKKKDNIKGGNTQKILDNKKLDNKKLDDLFINSKIEKQKQIESKISDIQSKYIDNLFKNSEKKSELFNELQKLNKLNNKKLGDLSINSVNKLEKQKQLDNLFINSAKKKLEKEKQLKSEYLDNLFKNNGKKLELFNKIKKLGKEHVTNEQKQEDIIKDQNNSLKLQEDLNNIIQLKPSTIKTELIKDFKDKYKNNKTIDINKLFINNDDINNKYLKRDIILSEKNISESINRLNIENKNIISNRKIIKPYEPFCISDNNPDFINTNEFDNKKEEISKRKKQEQEYKELQLDLEDKETNLEPYESNDFDNYSIFDC